MDFVTKLMDSIDIGGLLAILDIQIGLGVIIAFSVFSSVISRAIIKICYLFLKKKGYAKDSTFYKPLQTLVVLLGFYIAVEYIFPIEGKIVPYLSKGFRILIIFIMARAFANSMKPESIFFDRLEEKTLFKGNKGGRQIISKIIKVVIYVFATLMILGEADINLTGLIAGLGIASTVIALAAQDMVKSLLSGAVILTDKPFQLGDWIEVGNYAGTVLDITFRSTRIQTITNAIVTIPNSLITAESVTNWNKLKTRRVDIALKVDRNTNLEKAKRVISKIKLMLENNEDIVEESAHVYLANIGIYSLDINILFYLKTNEYMKHLYMKEHVMEEIIQIFDNENVEFAYPSSKVMVREPEITKEVKKENAKK